MAAYTLIKKMFSGGKPVLVLFILLLVSLYLMSKANHNSTLFGEIYSIMLGINILAIILFIGLIGRSFILLIQQYRNQVTGSRLTVKLVVMFIILSATPVSVVYYFSLDFIKQGIDSWFDVRVESALNDSLKLSQASLGIRMSELLNYSDAMAKELSNLDNSVVGLRLNDLRFGSDAIELALFSLSGRIIAISSGEAGSLLPMNLENRSRLVLSVSSSNVSLIPIKDRGLHIQVVVKVQPGQVDSELRYLHALYPVPAHVSELAESVEKAFGHYREIAYLRVPLKYSFIFTLSLVLLLSILVAIWAAFFIAQRMVAPITDLVEGTRAVAAGDYEKRLPLPSKDELGDLVQSFNDMTHRISQARNEARASQKQLEAQHAYLDAVLNNLTSGVITIDNENCLYTFNPIAAQILQVNLDQCLNKPLACIAEQHSNLKTFSDTVDSHMTLHEYEWNEEITLFNPGGRQILMCRSTRLPERTNNSGSTLIVFDDITTQIQAQRNAAWGEVARRLAHEIKNPLTPIQLSAERLRHKYLNTMAPEDAEVLDRSTHTIVQQVETLKEMVKAFSDYARTPTLHLEEINLNKLIEDVLELYRGSHYDIHFKLDLDSATPHIEADKGRLHQVLHNLIKNAIEALIDHKGDIFISTRCAKEQSCHYVEMCIEDSGPGFPHELSSQLFDPYITSKPKGTGLGLAIVKKIIEEHGGMIEAENCVDTANQNCGARIVIRLPVIRMRDTDIERQTTRQTQDASS
jgi:nitrogen fixation/metabolism regulation signal transduction histidine kinase